MSAADRLKDAIDRVIREMLPRVKFLGTYEYRLVSQSSFKVDAIPTDSTLGLPTLTKLEMRPSIIGGKGTLQSGSSVLVTFINGDPGRPMVSFSDPNADPEKIALVGTEEIKLNNGVLGAARMTDPVIAGPWSGTIVSGSTTTKIG